MALQIFNNMPRRMLSGLALHGVVQEALKFFEVMIVSGVKPKEVTFVAIMTACCHSGLVDEGLKY